MELIPQKQNSFFYKSQIIFQREWNKFNKTKRLKVLLLFMFILIIIVSFFLFSINTARPGDLFFTVKAFVEAKELSTYKDNSGNFYLKKLDDRVSAFQSIANSNNCVQLLLGQDEIYTALKGFHSQNLSKNTLEMVTQEESSLIKLNNIKTSCLVSSSIKQLPDLISYIKFYYASINDQRNILVNYRSDLQNKYNDLTDQFKKTNIKDQNKLNQLQSIIIFIKRNFENIDKNIDDSKQYLNSYISYSSALLAISTANNTFSGDVIKAENFQAQVQSICLISINNSECDLNNVTSKWNSIYEKSDLFQQLTLGQNFFSHYISFLIPELKITQSSSSTSTQPK